MKPQTNRMIGKIFLKRQGNEYFIHQNCMPDQCSAPKYLILHNHFPHLLQSLQFLHAVSLSYIGNISSSLESSSRQKSWILFLKLLLLPLCCSLHSTDCEEPGLLKAEMSVGG